jgi:hypothetical protein
MHPIEEQPATAPPSLTKKQLELLKKPGPFRVYMITASGPNPKGKRQRLGLKLVNPKMEGLLHEVAEILLEKKTTKGQDFVVEDPRTTQILWTTASAGESK